MRTSWVRDSPPTHRDSGAIFHAAPPRSRVSARLHFGLVYCGCLRKKVDLGPIEVRFASWIIHDARFDDSATGRSYLSFV
jgi:hypothetical protein